MKSIDKFGHYRGYQGKPGPAGLGFQTDKDGNYDMSKRILTNAKDPVNEQDLVTKYYLKRKLNDRFVLGPSASYLSFQRKRLVEIADPRDASDCVTVNYMRSRALVCEDKTKTVDGKSCVLTNLGTSEKPVAERWNDAVTVGYTYSLLATFAGKVEKELGELAIALRKEIHGVPSTSALRKVVNAHLDVQEKLPIKKWRPVMNNKGVSHIEADNYLNTIEGSVKEQNTAVRSDVNNNNGG